MNTEERIEKAYESLDLETLENSSMVILLQLEYVDKNDIPALRSKGFKIPPQAKKGGSVEIFEATVLAVGDKVKRVSPGDRVVFGQNHFSTIVRNDIEYLLMADRDIVARVKKGTKDVKHT